MYARMSRLWILLWCTLSNLLLSNPKTCFVVLYTSLVSSLPIFGMTLRFSTPLFFSLALLDLVYSSFALFPILFLLSVLFYIYIFFDGKVYWPHLCWDININIIFYFDYDLWEISLGWFLKNMKLFWHVLVGFVGKHSLHIYTLMEWIKGKYRKPIDFTWY